MLSAGRYPLFRAHATIVHSRTMATQTNPSQWRGHVRWMKGLTSEAIGSLVSQSLRASGRAVKASGIEEMRAAKEIADRRVENRLQNKRSSVPLIMEGHGEHLAGWALGCEGMKQRGGRKVEVGGQKMGPGPGPGDANGPSQ